MHPAPRQPALTAICLYIAAYLLTIVLHEMGHAVMALAVGDHPILFLTPISCSLARRTYSLRRLGQC
jgi:hypothetical protein